MANALGGPVGLGIYLPDLPDRPDIPDLMLLLRRLGREDRRRLRRYPVQQVLAFHEASGIGAGAEHDHGHLLAADWQPEQRGQ